ncbi:MAG: ABC transporter permease [Oscillospiraceae bacterium]|nr:ABC transporter permease [Oscillospiraceae bacterium]
MYIIQNALKNVVRNRGRNILIAAIIFAIIVTTVVTLIIDNTTSGIIDDYKTRFGSQVNISPDIEKFRSGGNMPSAGEGMKLPEITPQQSIDFANSEYVKEYVMQIMIGVASESLKGKDESQGSGFSPIGDDGKSVSAQFYLKNVFFDFDGGYRGIADGNGRMVENDNECLVSEAFAQLNNLFVGDTITLCASLHNADMTEYRQVNYELSLVGIYYDLTEEYAGIQVPMANRRNEILTTTNTILDPVGEGESGFSVSSTYFLKNPSMLKDFEAEIREKGLSEYLKVSTDENGYNSIVGPVEGLKSISMTFMLIVLILGAIILILLSTIAIRERKYEIGVLRAMGMKKHKVALGLWLEMIAVTCVCLCIGLIVGSLIAQSVSDMLLVGQVEAAKAAGGLPGGAIASADASSLLAGSLSKLETLTVSLDTSTILKIIGISILLASVAGLAAICKITKYEPIKILMERN